MGRSQVGARATDLVVAEAVGAVVFTVAAIAGGGWVWSAVIAVLLGGAALIPVRGSTIPRWCAVAVSYHRDKHAPAEHVTTRSVDGDLHIGIRWDGCRMSSVLEVEQPRSGITRIDRNGAIPDQRFPLDALMRCLGHHDLAPVAIDITSHGFRGGSPSRAADTYGRLIGPLPAVASRTVWVTVSIDVRRTDSVIARRGGDVTAAAQAVGVATARVERALRAGGIVARGLTSSEMARASRIVSGGVPDGASRTRWSRVDGPTVTRVSHALAPRSLTTGALDAAWALPASSATSTVYLRRCATDDSVLIGATYSVAVPAGENLRGSVPASTSLCGRQRRATRIHTPGATASHDSIVPMAELSAANLMSIVVPTTGCGQLVGSDNDGRGVAVRLFGPALPTSHIAGELFLIQQLVFRAVALGAYVHVNSDRPHAWYQLAESVSDARGLTVGDATSATPTTGPDLVVFDGLTDRPPSPVASTMYATDSPSLWPASPADVTLVQPDCAGESVVLSTGDTSVWLILVTIEQETQFIGRPRIPLRTRA